jgi:hypothetical protein
VEEVDERAFLFEEGLEPMCSTLLSEPVRSTGTSLVFSVGSKEHAGYLESSAPSTIATLMAASSSEAMVTVASSQHSRSHS